MSRYYRHNPDEQISHGWTGAGSVQAGSGELASSPCSPNAPEGLKPPHKCEIIARAPNMAEGRDWWIGRLTEPVFVRGTKEKFCLHLKTPLKDVVFLLNDGDLGQLAVLLGCAQGKPICERWVERLMPRAFDAANSENDELT